MRQKSERTTLLIICHACGHAAMIVSALISFIEDARLLTVACPSASDQPVSKRTFHV
jgi:hypothetical protein